MGALSTPIPHPETPLDFVWCERWSMANAMSWKNERKLARWYSKCRLNWRDAHMPSPMVMKLLWNWRSLGIFPGIENNMMSTLDVILKSAGPDWTHSVQSSTRQSKL